MVTKYLSCPAAISECRNINASHLLSFLTYLEERAYASGTIHSYLSAVVHYEHWKRSTPTHAKVSIDSLVMDFLNEHLLHCQCQSSFPRQKKSARAALKHWCKIVDPTANKIGYHCPHARLIEGFDDFLWKAAGLSIATRLRHRRHALGFLDWLVTIRSLQPEQVTSLVFTDYIILMASVKTRETAASIATSMRKLSSYLSSQGYCSDELSPSLPRPKVCHDIPSTPALSTHEIEQLLTAFDRSYPVGKRDYAMARCLVDMGVRTSEVADLRVNQINWRSGVVTLDPGKTRRQRTLPMPQTTADALIDYLRYGRPATQGCKVFVHHRAPIGQGVKPCTVRQALRRAFERAGFNAGEAQVHRLRHTMATRLLHNGNSLKTIADVLGHRSINTTTRYTYIDYPSLAKVAMPWPRRMG